MKLLTTIVHISVMKKALYTLLGSQTAFHAPSFVIYVGRNIKIKEEEV